MKKIDGALVKEVKIFVTSILTSELSDKCLFHTINHTLDVLKNAEFIGRYSMLNEEDMNLLRISALFHDVGYVNAYDGHERYSAERATAFLRSKNIEEKSIDIIEGAILSTRMPQSPKNEISKILCDSDLMYLAFDDYFEQSELMRLEWENVGKAKLNIHQ
ncbi:MAG: HD domain-containing protein, partial [Bacteroidia bacterium]